AAMAEDDREWVFESIVGYLGSPIWLIPINEFIETKSLVFDDEEENKLSYTDIHLQYKTLVERLLDNYMKEVGISEQQFLDACTSPFAKSKTMQSVFQPILATDDFQMFRSMMAQKNLELQLQALRLIKETSVGSLPDSLTDGVDEMKELEEQEMSILQEVLKKSKEEYEEERRRQLLEAEAPSARGSSSNKAAGVSREARGTTDAPSQQRNTAKVETTSFSDCLSDAPKPTVCLQSRSVTEGAVGWPRILFSSSSSLFQELSTSQQEELQQRAAYLRLQRDKLHALKKEQQRSKPTAPEAAATPEPTTTSSSSSPEVSAEERKRLQKRKHLADKLKEEVIRK
uniref:Cilia- and flagella-associated protein 36 n=1 Tax=Tetraodon nigroviridis TaxID=99883 RepID=H3C0M9_TETNG